MRFSAAIESPENISPHGSTLMGKDKETTLRASHPIWEKDTKSPVCVCRYKASMKPSATRIPTWGKNDKIVCSFVGQSFRRTQKT